MGFFKVTWGQEETSNDRTDPQPTFPVSPTQATEAMRVIKEAWVESQDPLADPSSLKAKSAWVGGAVAIFALLTGEAAGEVVARLNGSPTTSPYAGMIKPVPTSITRPAAPPGAQRPVKPGSAPSFEGSAQGIAILTTLPTVEG